MKFSQKHPLLSNLILMILLSIIIIGGVFWGAQQLHETWRKSDRSSSPRAFP